MMVGVAFRRILKKENHLTDEISYIVTFDFITSTFEEAQAIKQEIENTMLIKRLTWDAKRQTWHN